jgi:dTMP kinase
MARGRFITFEGGEGAGKSTQVRRLAARLRERAIETVATREPGGSPEAERIRQLIVTGAVDRWSAEAEVLLNYAARDAHLRATIRPALVRGAWVLSDRFFDSTRAYQALAGGAEPALVDLLERIIVADTRPDVTLVMDIDPERGLARANRRRPGANNRFERMGARFHRRLREAFLEVARADPARCVVIDAGEPVECVAEAVWHAVAGRFLD